MAKQTAALTANTNKPSQVFTSYSSEKDRWKEVSLTESIRISELLEMMRQSRRADHFPVIIIQPATVAALALLEDLENQPNFQAAFYKICIVLRAASRRLHVSQAVLRLLTKTTKEKHITLPDGCEQLLAGFNNAIDLEGDLAAKANDMGLDYLLKGWDDLDRYGRHWTNA